MITKSYFTTFSCTKNYIMITNPIFNYTLLGNIFFIRYQDKINGTFPSFPNSGRFVYYLGKWNDWLNDCKALKVFAVLLDMFVLKSPIIIHSFAKSSLILFRTNSSPS